VAAGTQNVSGGGASGASGGETAGQPEPSLPALQSQPLTPLQGAVAAGASGGGTDDQAGQVLAVSATDAMGTPTVLQVVPKVFRQTRNQDERLDLISPGGSSKESRKQADDESRRYVTTLKSSRKWFWL